MLCNTASGCRSCRAFSSCKGKTSHHWTDNCVRVSLARLSLLISIRVDPPTSEGIRNRWLVLQHHSCLYLRLTYVLPSDCQYSLTVSPTLTGLLCTLRERYSFDVVKHTAYYATFQSTLSGIALPALRGPSNDYIHQMILAPELCWSLDRFRISII